MILEETACGQVLKKFIKAGAKKILSHSDADGICSAFIAARMTGCENIHFVDDFDLGLVDHGTLVLDLGGGFAKEILQKQRFMIDHHKQNEIISPNIYINQDDNMSTCGILLLAYAGEASSILTRGILGHNTDMKPQYILEKAYKTLLENKLITNRQEFIEFDTNKSLLSTLWITNYKKINTPEDEFILEFATLFNIHPYILKNLKAEDFDEEDLVLIQTFFANTYRIELALAPRIRFLEYDNLMLEHFGVLINSAGKLGMPFIAFNYLNNKNTLKSFSYLREISKMYYKKGLKAREKNRITFQNITLFIIDDEILRPRLIGAIANMLKSKYKLQNLVVFYIEKEKIKASFRTSENSFSKIASFFTTIPNCLIGGHEKAIGCTFQKSSMKEVYAFLDKEF
jgi:hypothetical protein